MSCWHMIELRHFSGFSINSSILVGLWDTGKVSAADLSVIYAGKALSSRSLVYFMVRARDNSNRARDWSCPATFEIGLLQPSGWSA